MFNIFTEVLLLCIALQFIAWLWQIKTQNADIVDITWSMGIVICSLYYYFSLSTSQPVSILLLIFPALWYLRLSLHLIVRYREKHEDSRYTYLRKHWQKNTQFKFFMFFQFQALLIFIFVLPAYWVSYVPFEWSYKIILAFIIGGISLIGVTLSDKQLYQFKTDNNNRKKVCDSGLWKYSRHPNYFFEWCHWFVYPVLLFNTPYFYWALIYPLLMLVFLLKLTGIPFSEQQSLINRGDTYRDYQNRTNKFFPWKPKNQ
jgi:steroid 5-alpha reductase family enzyme